MITKRILLRNYVHVVNVEGQQVKRKTNVLKNSDYILTMVMIIPFWGAIGFNVLLQKD